MTKAYKNSSQAMTLNFSDKVPHPYKTTGKIIFLYILTLIIIIIFFYCSNLIGKCWAIKVAQNFPDYPGESDYRVADSPENFVLWLFNP